MDITAPTTVTGSGLHFAPNQALNAPAAFDSGAFDSGAFDTDFGLIDFYEAQPTTTAGLVFIKTTQVDA